MATVSIIIVNYNQIGLTAECIKSIYEKTDKTDFEIIVVDNASPEGDPEILLKSFPEIKLIKSVENLGFAGGNNLGVKHASGDFILLLNNDTVLENDAISICRNFLDSHPECAVVASKILNYEDDGIQHNCQRFPSATYNLIELFRLQKLMSEKKKGEVLLGSFFSHDHPVYPDWVWGTFFMFRRSLLKQFKNEQLPDDFFMYFEDMQWCLEINHMGYKIGFEPAAVIRHRKGGSEGNKPLFMKENEKKFMKMHYPLWQRILIGFTRFLLKSTVR